MLLKDVVCGVSVTSHDAQWNESECESRICFASVQNEAQGENQHTEPQTGAGRSRTDAVRAQRPGQRRPAASVRTGVSSRSFCCFSVSFGVSNQIWINISCSGGQQPMLCSECMWYWLLASGIISWIFHMGLIWSCSVMLLTLSFLLSIWSSSHVSVSLSLCSGLMWSSVCLWTGRRFCWTRDRRSPRVGLFLVIWSLWFYLSKHKLSQKPWAEQTQPHPVRRWALTGNILMK